MQSNVHLLPIIKDNETIRKTILTNIIKMLCERKLLNKQEWMTKIDSFIAEQNENQHYIVNIDNKNDNSTDTIHIKLIFQKISNIGNSPIIMDFIKDYANVNKIIIVDEISDKMSKYFDAYKKIEVFTKHFFMINIIDHICSPKYEILTDDEMDLFKKEYGIAKSKMKKMYEKDPIALYYNAKHGQIIRIIRSSSQTGTAIDYRVVIKLL